MVKEIRSRINKSKASRGQIIIMAALFVVVLTGMVGISIDLGYAFAEKRTVQNAADAAAIAGAQALTEWSTSNPLLAAGPDVSKLVSDNTMNGSTTQTYSCNYLDDSGKNLGPCTLVVPPTATGVHVVVHETHGTFFIRVVPGGPKTVTTSASATAHVQGVTVDSGLGSSSPFIVCGIDTKLANHGGGTQSILMQDGSGKWVIDPDNAYGKTYVIHDTHVSKCGSKSEDFKGLANQDNNTGATVPGWMESRGGDVAGPTRTAVNGVKGCAPGDPNPDGCVLIVPIASKAVDGNFYVVAVGAFLITQCHANCHQGTLLKDYVFQPGGQGQWTDSNGWKPGDPGLVTVRLTN